MKRGQLEIIGFMVIIILLLFSLIFYFKFAANDSTDLLQEAEENLEVSNLLDAIKMYTICDDTQMSDVIKSCVDGGNECDEDACAIVEREVQQIISLNGWDNDTYMFHIGDILYSQGTCKGNTFVDDYITNGETIKLTYCYWLVKSIFSFNSLKLFSFS